MAKAAQKPQLATVAPAAAEEAKPAARPAPAHPEHQPVRTGTPARTHDPGQPRATTGNAWADLHPQRIWPD